MADLVGYGETADWSEGFTGPGPATGPGTAALRLGHGNYDTDDNAWDFLGDTPAPRNAVSPVGNRRPQVTTPAELGTPVDTAVTFSTAAGTAITVSDPDAGTADLAVTLTAAGGTLTLGGTTGLTFTDGDGTADPTMTFTGTVTAINTALNGLSYLPATGYSGGGSVTAWADDQGNTGAGGALIESGRTSLVIGGPVVAADDAAETNEDTATDVDVMANDVWLGATTPTLTITAGPAHGTASVVDGRIRYTPAAEWSGTDSLTYRLADGLGNASTATLAVTVAEVNDARIETTGEPHMYADEGGLVDETFDTPDATQAITWSDAGCRRASRGSAGG